MGYFINKKYQYWTCDVNKATCTVKMKDMDIEQEENELKELDNEAKKIMEKIKDIRKNKSNSDKTKVNLDVLDAESQYRKLNSDGKNKEEKVQVYTRNSNIIYEVNRLKDIMTSEEVILIQANRDGIDNGRIVTSITKISQDIKKLEKFGICMPKKYFDELANIITDNYFDIECTHREYVENDIPEQVIKIFVQICCQNMKDNLNEYLSADEKHYDVRTTTLKEWHSDCFARKYSLTDIKEAMVIYGFTDKPNRGRTDCNIGNQRVVRFNKDVIEKIIADSKQGQTNEQDKQ